MNRPLGSIVLAATVVSLAPRAAAMGTLRLAVVVGNDVGAGDRPPLRYAEEDAAKVGRVLQDLGGVSPSDLYVLQGRSLLLVGAALDRVGQRVAEEHRATRRHAMLIFYFSGHSDGEALELGADRLPFAELRRRLTATGADVRVAIVDSCRSGALLAAKGGKRGPPFEIRLSDDPPTAGQVLISASAAEEEALESPEIRGSYFTHHLVSGLRGAADSTGAGRVTLAEAYRYAYTHTVAATADTVVGAQHPSYDIQLSGMGELVLTELSRPSAALVLPAADRAIISDPWRDEVLAEVPADAPRRVAVPPGDYLVRVWRGPAVYAGRIALAPASVRTVAWTDLGIGAAVSTVTAKGDAPPDTAAADLAQALSLMNQMNDSQAKLLLTQLLERRPPAQLAAKAHMALAMIAFNELHSDDAKREFQLALWADPAIELPTNSSPKAELAFSEARRQLAQSLNGAGAPLLAAELTDAPKAHVAAPPQAVAVAAEPVPAHSRALAYVLAGVAVLALGVGIYGEVAVASYNSAIAPGNKSPATWGPALQSQQSAANVWQYAAIGCFVAAAGGGAGTVLTW